MQSLPRQGVRATTYPLIGELPYQSAVGLLSLQTSPQSWQRNWSLLAYHYYAELPILFEEYSLNAASLVVNIIFKSI